MRRAGTTSIAVLGSTGSIGESTLSVISQHPHRYSVFALAANTDVDTMRSQCVAFRPRYAVMADAAAGAELRARLSGSDAACEVLDGHDALEFVASHPEVDAVMAAIVGAAGLPSALRATQAGKKILLANKESMVMAGGLLIDTAMRSGSAILPIDSEHNAIFQSLPSNYARSLESAGVRKLVLTASGGPFLKTPAEFRMPGLTGNIIHFMRVCCQVE